MPSVNTNIGALLAQKYLRATSAQLNSVQNHVSSGLRVAGSADDASTFAVAQGLRADIKSYVAVSSALSGAKAVATVAVTASHRFCGSGISTSRDRSTPRRSAASAPSPGIPTAAHHEPARDASASSASRRDIDPRVSA